MRSLEGRSIWISRSGKVGLYITQHCRSLQASDLVWQSPWPLVSVAIGATFRETMETIASIRALLTPATVVSHPTENLRRSWRQQNRVVSSTDNLLERRFRNRRRLWTSHWCISRPYRLLTRRHSAQLLGRMDHSKPNLPHRVSLPSGTLRLVDIRTQPATTSRDTLVGNVDITEQHKH